MLVTAALGRCRIDGDGRRVALSALALGPRRTISVHPTIEGTAPFGMAVETRVTVAIEATGGAHDVGQDIGQEGVDDLSPLPGVARPARRLVFTPYE